MSRSELQNVKPTAIYKLAEVFEAVNKDKAAYEAQLEGLSDETKQWARHWPPAYCAKALGEVAETLRQWQDQGITEIVAAAPFSDGCLTGPVENGIVEQFRKGRVQPLSAPAVK